MKASIFIDDLIERTRDNLNRVQQFMDLPISSLNYKPTPESWSILECLEHLNRYGDFYIPEISKRISISKHSSKGFFKTGWLGNYFAKSMLPKRKLNKMKTFKEMNPNGSDLGSTTLDTFVQQQHQLVELLDKARSVNLTKTKTSISINKWIKLRLGDTFRVVIYHNQRHIAQAEQVEVATEASY